MLSLLHDQARAAQLREVEGEGAVRNAQLLGDRARGHALVAGLDEQAEEREAMLLRQRAERLDGSFALYQRKLAQRIAAAQQGTGGRAMIEARILPRSRID